MGQHHVDRVCMCCCEYRCGCLSVPGPVGTLVIGLDDFGDFRLRARSPSVAAVANHTSLPPSENVIIAELAEFRVQTAAGVDI